MSLTEYENLKKMTNRLIAFINWKGGTLESKKKKIIKELSLIKEYCKECCDNNPNLSTKEH